MSGAKDESKYFNFTVELLQGFLIDKRTVLDNIFDYAVYAHTLKLEEGTETEKFKSACRYFAVKPGNIKNSLKNGELLFNSIPENSAKVGLSLSLKAPFALLPVVHFLPSSLYIFYDSFQL